MPLVGLNLTGMIGAVLYRRLLERFGSARAALAAPEGRLREVPGIGPLTARAIVAVARSGQADAEVDAATKSGVAIVAQGNPEYPVPLRSLYDPPIVLYRRGTYFPQDALGIGVVGSRKCTVYGAQQAQRFAADLASLGITVISGLARGVDTKAHLGALRAKEGRTVAVLGSGLQRIYPPENRELLEAICERGCAFSEFGLRSEPGAANFPRRNRLISGLSLGILVIEAQERSGALITADWAMEQGRDVFCVPGALGNPMSRGPHLLIKQGAKLAEGAMDIVEEIPAFAGILEKLGKFPALSPLERIILANMGDRPKTPDHLAAETRLPTSSVEAALERMTGKGVLRREGEAFARARSDDADAQ